MKKIAGKLLLLIPLGLVVLLTGAILTRKAKSEEEAGRIRILPELVITDLNGVEYNTALLTSGPLLITFFHPDCDHCRYELSFLKARGLLDSNIEILLVSYADKFQINSFIKELEISDSRYLHIIHDPEFKVSNYFGADIIPTNFIYNDSLRLVKVFKGSVTPETILTYLNDAN